MYFVVVNLVLKCQCGYFYVVVGYVCYGVYIELGQFIVQCCLVFGWDGEVFLEVVVVGYDIVVGVQVFGWFGQGVVYGWVDYGLVLVYLGLVQIVYVGDLVGGGMQMVVFQVDYVGQ